MVRLDLRLMGQLELVLFRTAVSRRTQNEDKALDNDSSPPLLNEAQNIKIGHWEIPPHS